MSTVRSRILAAAAWLVLAGTLPRALAAQTNPELLLRLDDVGMNHSVNTAIKRVADSGIPFSVSVLFVCPWWQEAVDMLKQYPQVSVGVHLALNSEWKSYRWGPVLGRSAVPTLVDTNGYFVQSTRAFQALKFDLGEVERELSAQVERGLRSGLKIDYVDYHMSTAVSTPELRAVVEKIAAKYHLGISRYFAEAYAELFPLQPEQKLSGLLDRVRALDRARTNLIVVHVAEATPEMMALVDMNNSRMNTPAGEPLTYKHRQAELDAVLSPEFARAIRETQAKLVTYRDIIAAKGLQAMQRPGGSAPE